MQFSASRMGEAGTRPKLENRGTGMTNKNRNSGLIGLNRRSALKGLAASAGLMAAPGFVRYSQAQSSAPIKIGFQAHRTGIGAAYGRWYEKTTAAALKLINEAGGINGRPVE